MRTSEQSLREQASRFFAMAEAARDEGKPDLAYLLTEAAQRAKKANAPKRTTVGALMWVPLLCVLLVSVALWAGIVIAMSNTGPSPIDI